VLSLLDALVESGLDQEQVKQVNQAKGCVEHQLNLLNDVLDLTKVRVGPTFFAIMKFCLPSGLKKGLIVNVQLLPESIYFEHGLSCAELICRAASQCATTYLSLTLQIEAGKMIIDEAPFSLIDTLESLADAFVPARAKKDLELCIDIAGE
jgi:signal transduction histidine kinase